MFRKPPQLDDFQSFLKNTQEFVNDRRQKVTDDPQYWAYTGLRTGFFLANGIVAANQNNLDIFYNNKSDDAKKLSEEENI